MAVARQHYCREYEEPRQAHDCLRGEVGRFHFRAARFYFEQRKPESSRVLR